MKNISENIKFFATISTFLNCKILWILWVVYFVSETVKNLKSSPNYRCQTRGHRHYLAIIASKSGPITKKDWLLEQNYSLLFSVFKKSESYFRDAQII